MDTIKIKGSKRKLLVAMLGSLTIGIAAFWGAISPKIFISTIYNDTLFIQITGAFAALLSALCLVLLVREYFIKKFNIIINGEGIIDNSSFASVGMIKWEDIISIKHTTVMSQKLLFVNVKNPKDYINSQNAIKNILLKINLKMYGTPIILSSNSLNCNFYKLEEIIVNSLSRYRNNNLSSG